MHDYYVAGGHGPVDLADGRIGTPGQKIKLSAEDVKHEHNARLIEEGWLIKVQAQDRPRAAKQDEGEE